MPKSATSPIARTKTEKRRLFFMTNLPKCTVIYEKNHSGDYMENPTGRQAQIFLRQVFIHKWQIAVQYKAAAMSPPQA
jgi:hypothetical protein